MSKKLMQEAKTLEKRNVWLRNQKPMMSLVSKAADQSPIALGSSAPYSLGTLKAQSSNSNLAGTGRPVARGLNENTASSSQVWHSDVNPSSSAGKPVAETSRKPIGTQQSHHNLRMSKNNAGHLEKVYSYSRQKFGREPGDDMPEIDNNAMIWRIFTSATMKVAEHLGQNYQENVPPRMPTSKRSSSCSTFHRN